MPSRARTARRPSTALTGALCRAAGLSTIVAGNIGDAVLDVLERLGPDADRRPWPDVLVLELSSFQLETTASLAPTAAAVLNVTDNHLDRYAGIDAYARRSAASSRAAARRCSTATIRARWRWRSRGAKCRRSARRCPFAEGEWGLVTRRDHGGGVWLARGGALLVPAADLALVGRHNALNALAALALTSRGGEDLAARAARADALRRPAAPDAAARRGGRRALRRRLQGDDHRRRRGPRSKDSTVRSS